MSQHEGNAIIVVEVLGEIVDLADDGIGANDIVPAMVALYKLVPVFSYVSQLPKDQYDEFVAECVDQAVGNEENAIVKEAWLLGPDELEKISDGLKTIILTILNREE